MRPFCTILAFLILLGAAPSRAEESGRVDRSWLLWWMYSRPVPGPGPEAWSPLPRKTVRDEILPALREFSGSEADETHQDILSAALLGRARLSHQEIDILAVEHWAGVHKGRRTERPGVPAIVEESAILGLGLLCRRTPGAQLGAARLDVIRGSLLSIAGDESRRTRCRAFALFSLGLLGDQPSGLHGLAEVQEQATTERLFELLTREAHDPDLGVALLVAIRHQRPRSVTNAQCGHLRQIALEARLGDAPVPPLVSAWAVSVLAHLGGTGDIAHLGGLLGKKDVVEKERRRAAAVGLGLLGRTRTGRARLNAATLLAAGMADEADPWTRHNVHISLARLLAADAQDGATSLLEDGRAAARIEASLERGSIPDQASAAIATGLVLRAMGNTSASERAFQHRARAALLAGLQRDELSRDVRIGLLLAAGLSQDPACRPHVFEALRDDASSTAHAIQAAAMYPSISPAEARDLGHLMCTRDIALGRVAFLALIRHGDPIVTPTDETAVDLIRARLALGRRCDYHTAITLRLGFSGDARVVPDLLRVLHSADTHRAVTRAIACVALTLIGRPEHVPALMRLRVDVVGGNFTDALGEVWGTL